MLVACALDFSPASIAALHVGARLAAAAKGNLALIAVDESAAGDERILRLAAEREAETARALGAPVSSIVVVRGDPAERIVGACRDARADLVVLGAHGTRDERLRSSPAAAAQAAREGTRGAGRTAERVAATAPMPVLVVRDETPFLAWLDGARPLHVVMGASLEASVEAARGFVSRLRALAPCDVTALHVAFPPAMWSAVHVRWPETVLAGPPVPGAFEEEHRATAVLERALAERMGALPGEGALHLRVAESFRRSEDGILELAEREHADVIVLGAHRRPALERLWYGSVAADVLRHARQNVVVAPDVVKRSELPRIGTVLVPVEHADGAARAVAVGCALAGAGGRVLLLHVAKRALDEAARAALRRDLFALVPGGSAKAGVAVESAVLVDEDVAGAVSAIALSEGADLVCMRVRAHHPAGPLLGSMHERLIARCSCPVVVVRDEP